MPALRGKFFERGRRRSPREGGDEREREEKRKWEDEGRGRGVRGR